MEFLSSFRDEKSLNLLHERGVLQPENSRSIQTNIDGLQLFKSMGMQLWLVVKEPLISYTEPFLIGLFVGSAKPTNVAGFLLDFVNKAKIFLYAFDMFGHCSPPACFVALWVFGDSAFCHCYCGN